MQSIKKIVQDLELYLILEQRLSQNSVVSYLSDIKRLVVFLKKNKIEIKKIESSTFQNFLQAEALTYQISAATLNRRMASCKMFIKFLESHYQIKPIQITKIFVEKRKKIPILLSQADLKTLVNFLFDINFYKDTEQENYFHQFQERMILIFLYTLGLRASEICGLEIQNLNLEEKIIKVLGKGEKERFIPIPQEIISLIKNYLEIVRPQTSANTIFFNQKKVGPKKFSRQQIFVLVKKYSKALRLNPKISPHKFRHSIATHLLEVGANLRILQEFLGHASVSTVQIYTHTNLKQLRKEYDQYHPRSKINQ